MIFTGASGNDPKNDFEAFLRNYAWILCLVVVVLIVLTIVIIFLIKGRKKDNKKPLIAPPDEWVDALGGKENITDISATGSRLAVKLVDVNLVNREALTNLGVSSIVQMSGKLTLVTNLDNQKIVENIKNCLQN